MELKGKKVLITGADGFIGSHLAELLLEKGCKVRAMSLYNSFNSWGWLEHIPNLDELEVVSGDIRDGDYCRKMTQDVDVVFHLAALIGIPYSYRSPRSYVDTNVTGTLNLCQAALDCAVEKFIHTSTSEVYGTAQYVPIDENHQLQPQSPYSASKIAADSMALSFYNAFDLPVAIARPFNTFGPRQSARAVIPTIITQLLSGNTTLSLGDLTPTRDFTFVKDTCTGLIAIAESDKTIGEAINIGSNFEISIQNLAETIAALMNTSIDFSLQEERRRPKKSEVFRLYCNNEKIKVLTNYMPAYSLEEGLKTTIAWFSEEGSLEKYKTKLYNV